MTLTPRLVIPLVAAAAILGAVVDRAGLWLLTPAPRVSLPATLEGKPGRLLSVQADANGPVRWFTPADLDLVEQADNRLLIVAPAAGTYPVYAYTARGNVPSAPAVMQVIVGGPGPLPPDPPTPVPPQPVDGNRVLIVYESADLAKLPDGQRQILHAKPVRDYLDSRCAPDGKVKAWRIWDADVDTRGESKQWQDAMKRPRLSVPWVWINGRTVVYEGPLPKTVEDALALLKKHLE